MAESKDLLRTDFVGHSKEHADTVQSTSHRNKAEN